VFTYFIRYLPPKENGLGTIISHAITSVSEMSIKDIKEKNPEVFEQPGFYSLMLAKDDHLTIGKDK
jgi:hypothetical protein